MKLKLIWPTNKLKFITQQFGGNSIAVYAGQGMKGHNGMDLMAFHGTEIIAAHDGTAYYQIDDAGGHGVIIITNEKYEYKDGEAYYKTIYWHLIDPIKEPEFHSPIQDFPYGKQVKAGDVVGYANSTGQSTGDHLHFGLKPLEKVSNGLWKNIEQDNGYFGAIDPSPYFEELNPHKDTFQKDLKYRMTDPDVKKLQVWLNTHGYALKTSDLGSSGKETTYFGALTLDAVKRLQRANNLPQTGYVGKLTREVINKI